MPSSLDNLKSKVDTSDVGKLKHVPVDLKKLNDDVVRKTVSDELT